MAIPPPVNYFQCVASTKATRRLSSHRAAALLWAVVFFVGVEGRVLAGLPPTQQGQRVISMLLGTVSVGAKPVLKIDSK